MNTDFLLQENWPVLGSGNHSAVTVKVHEWCGKISEFVRNTMSELLWEPRKLQELLS